MNCLIQFKDGKSETARLYFHKKLSLFQRDEEKEDRSKRKWECVKEIQTNP